MLYLFRRIRRSLLESKDMKRYLLYALGEVALVVIGILLALQINVWNENRILKKEEFTYLTNLKRDVDAMIQEFDQYHELITFDKQSAIKALRTLESCQLDDTSKKILDEVLEGHQSLGMPTSKRSAYDEMLATGTFARMNNDSLKLKITGLYAALASGGDRLNYFREELGRASQVIMNHVGFSVDDDRAQMTNPTYDFNRICSNPTFRNAMVEVVDARADVLWMVNVTQDGLAGCRDLLELEISQYE